MKMVIDRAIVEQAESDHETRAELAEQQVVQLAEERDHYRNLWQKAQQAEPVAWRVNVGGTWFHARDREALMSALVVVLGCSLNGIQPEPLYTAPPQRPAEPVQEPAAWRFKPMIGSPWALSDDGYYISCKRDQGYIVEALGVIPTKTN